VKIPGTGAVEDFRWPSTGSTRSLARRPAPPTRAHDPTTTRAHDRPHDPTSTRPRPRPTTHDPRSPGHPTASPRGHSLRRGSDPTGIPVRRAVGSPRGHERGTKTTLTRHPGVATVHWMEFSPAIDPRLYASVGRAVDLRSSAAVWRGLRRRAQRLRTTTPCYESVRKLVAAERERRARLVATATTLLEIGMWRVPALPEDVSRIYRRRLTQSRRWLRARTGRPP